MERRWTSIANAAQVTSAPSPGAPHVDRRHRPSHPDLPQQSTDYGRKAVAVEPGGVEPIPLVTRTMYVGLLARAYPGLGDLPLEVGIALAFGLHAVLRPRLRSARPSL